MFAGQIRAVATTAALVLITVSGGVALAQDESVDQLIELVRTKPPDMEQDAWKEKRRSATRKLGNLADRKAVPVLIQIVETEEFDVVAEIAIEALGKLGDDRAAPALRKVANDKDRDRFMRKAARQALKKLGVSSVGPTSGDDDDDGGGLIGPVNGGGSMIGQAANVKIPTGPKFSDDTLAATDRLTLALGGMRLQWDAIRETPSLDTDIAASYERTLDREKSAYRYRGDAAVAGSVVDSPGLDKPTRTIVFNSQLVGAARFYFSENPLYGIAQGGLGMSLFHIKVNPLGVGNTLTATNFGVDVAATIGAGYGRVIDRGEALRLRRIEKLLRESRALGRPITPDLAEKIMRAWWTLRDEIGAHQRLVITVRILREAGVLLGEPDASTTYKILQTLLDGQLNRRPDGMDFNLSIGEAFLIRDDDVSSPDSVEDGRIESVLASGAYGKQTEDGLSEVVGELFGRYRILGDDTAIAPWAVGVSAAWRRFMYSDYYDPIGALEITAQVGASSDGVDMNPSASDEIAIVVGGTVGWLWRPNRASQYRLAASLRFESDEIFLGVVFEALYGFLDATFVAAPNY